MTYAPAVASSEMAGSLVVTNVNHELNDQDLARFFQQLIVNVTGIDGTLVLPRWRPEPANMPDFGLDWASVGVTGRKRDRFAFEGRATQVGYGQGPYGGNNPAVAPFPAFTFGSGNYGAGTFGKSIPIPTSDGTGASINPGPASTTPYGGNGHCVIRQQELDVLLSFYGPNSEYNTEQFAMGLGLAQNREIFSLNGMGLIEVEDSTTVPELNNQRWLYRVDTPFRIRRQQKYTYQVLDVTVAGVIVYLDNPVAQYILNVTD